MKKCTSNINGDVIMKKSDAICYNSQIKLQQQPNTNKSEYAFNTNINKNNVKINNCNGIKVVVKKKIMQKKQQQQQQQTKINNNNNKMVLMAELLVLLPFNESEQQSGIVTDLKEKFKKTEEEEMWDKDDDDAWMGIMMKDDDDTMMLMTMMMMMKNNKQANELLFVQQLEAMPWPLIPKQMLISFDDEVLITLIVVEIIIIILIITKISHISDENIKTVNKKCDLIDYLTKTNIKVNYYDYYANFSMDKQATIQQQQQINNNNDQNMCIDIKGITDKKLNFIEKPTKMLADDYHANKKVHTQENKPSFTTFDELCMLQQNEKRILAEAARQNKTIRFRLAGGGEGSLTNPQTGWGSPPNSQLGAGNPNAGSWGAANPPSQWGQGQNPGQQQRPLNSGPPQDSVNKNQNSVPNQAQGPPNMAATVQGQSGNSSAPNSNQAQQGAGGAVGNSGGNPQQQQQQPPQQVAGAGNNNGNFPPIGANPGGAAPGNNGGANPPGPNGNGGAQAVAGQAGAPTGPTAKNQLEQLNTMREALFSQDGWSCQNVNQDTNWDVPGSPEPGLKSDPNTPVQPLWKTGMNNGTELWEANLKCGGQPPPAPVAKSQWTPKVPFGGTWGADDEEENAAGNTVWNTNQQNNPSTAGGWNQNQGPVNAGFNAAPAPKLENEWNANPGNNWGDLRQQPPQTDPRNLPANLMRDNSVGSGTGISGRLNPNNIDWAQNKGPMMGVGGVTPTNGQWPQTGPKEMPTGKPSGWVEGTSPPRVGGRPPMPDYNDGTNLWQQNQRGVPGGAGPHWKDMPDGSRPNMPRPGVLNAANPGPIQSRLGPSGPLKQDMWQSGARTSWDEPPHTSGWDEGNKMPGGNANNAWDTNCWTNKPKPSGWPDNDLGIGSDWAAHGQKAPNKMVSSEIIRNSKQFRTLIDLGYKKEDAEIALRTTNSFEEAIDLLNQRSGAGGGNLSDQWRRHDEHPNAFDHPPRFPGAPTQTMPFPPNSNPNLLGNLGSNLTGNQINKMSQMPPNYAPPGSGPSFGQQPGSATGANPQAGSSQPSTQQLRMLVQQIQTAVHAGFLNHQILNQPLAPQTLILLNQLLTCIKQLQMYQSNMNRPGVNAVQANIITSKLQQQIKSLQNQITAQQQMYVKQAPSNMPNPNDYLRSPTDPAGSLINAFPDLNIGGKPDPAGFNQSISRLESQWKVGSKDSSDPSEFSRAPGTTAKSSISATPSIGLGSDSPWSSSVSGRDGGWPETSSDTKDVDWPSQPSPAFSELVVPEFKPGEPWKGTQQKSIEDDPSITPGSVARSPLSIAAKDSDLFSGASKTSPDIQPISLSNSTWSFTPSGQQSFSSAKANSNSTWSDTTPPIPKSMPTSAADLWSNNKAPRGPPPGLGSTKTGSGNGSGSSSNNWMGGLIGGRNSGSSGSGNWQSSGGSGWFSAWLLLKNLTAQIDGSTLRTLCMQHGPLQNFHLYLTHGIALCKYNSREEAQKAQTALNNCVLGNTTICAESPSENEVQSILQHLGAPSGGNQAGNGGNGGNSSASTGLSQTSWRPPSQGGPARPTGGSDAWASSWPTGTSTGNLWTPIDGVAGERGTPSNLSTFLPENLLGTELN